MEQTCNAIIELVKIKKHKVIALQFPDNMLDQAFDYVLLLKDKALSASLKSEFVVLNDSAYGSNGSESISSEYINSYCCINERAALKYGCDLIVFFGKHCFTPTKRISSLVIPTKSPFSIDKFSKALKKFETCLKKHIKLALIFDSNFQHLYSNLVTLFNNVSLIDLCEFSWKDCYSNRDILSSQVCSSFIGVNGQLYDREVLSDSDILLFIGKNETDELRLSFDFGSKTIFIYDQYLGAFETITLSTEAPLIFKNSLVPCRKYRKQLNKRVALIERARCAQTFGILVNNGDIHNIVEAINALKKLLRRKKLSFYTFFIENLSPQKLANFQNIDIFVILSCPNKVFIDSKAKEYFVPIITPSECEIALGHKTLPEISSSIVVAGLFNTEVVEEELPEVDTTSTISKFVISPAASYLSEQTFAGLDYDANVKPEKAELGETGIAAVLSSLSCSDSNQK